MARSSNDFVKLLELRGQQFAQASLDGILISVYDFANAIWQRPRLYTFVDHGIDHSYKVAQVALDILDKVFPQGVKLSPIERLVLGIASLIHDVGMQYDQYPKDGQRKTFDEIRSSHCEIGHQMISDALEGVFDSQRGGPAISLEAYHKLFIGYAEAVAFSHSGTLYWNRLHESMYSTRTEGGLQILRLRLLAAILRLADELHTEYTRIPNLSWINTSILTPEQKAHWVACYYVQDVKLSSPGPGSLRIRLRWRVSEDATEEEVSLIRSLLQELRERKATDEFDRVKEYLKWSEDMEECFFEYKMDAEPEKVSIQKLPREVVNYIVSQLRPYQFGSKKLPQIETVKELPSSPELDALKNSAQRFFLSGEGTLRGHYRLKTGWHTNNYVRCRNLIADINFTFPLCHALAKFYSQQKFTDIISIGTSAIRLGSLLSMLLSARHSFTFGTAVARGELAAREDYTAYEREVIIEKNSRVLIIDDILATGNVLKNLVDQLTHLPSPPQYLRLFCVYALGELSGESSTQTAMNIDYLLAFPDVLYLQEDPKTRTCEICRGNPHIIHDE